MPEPSLTPGDVMALVGQCRNHWLLLLKTGPNQVLDEAAARALQMAHLQHLFGLRARGKFAFFGPVADASDLVGIGVYLTATREEAEALAAADPAVIAGRFRAEIHGWFTLPGEQLPG